MAKDTSHTGEKQLLEREYKRLGDRIRSIRIGLGFTSSEKFANEKGLSRAQYAKYENGKNLQFSNLVKVVKALGVSLKEFFSEGFD
jgi:transcriptional regulator with XRE-family HTH domain